MLSALAHGNDPGVGTEVSLVALSAAANLDAQRGGLYHDVILANLSDAARTALAKLMASGYVFQTDFAKKHQAIGKAEGKVEALLRVLEARGLEVTGEELERIVGETDLERLDRWLVRAIAATTTSEVLSG